MPNPEQEARRKIDAQLEEAGWAVQDLARVDFSASRRVALREVPLATGRCDYLLLVDRKPAGVVEAKKAWRPRLPRSWAYLIAPGVGRLQVSLEHALHGATEPKELEVIAAEIADDLQAALEQFATIAQDLR